MRLCEKTRDGEEEKDQIIIKMHIPSCTLFNPTIYSCLRKVPQQGTCMTFTLSKIKTVSRVLIDSKFWLLSSTLALLHVFCICFVFTPTRVCEYSTNWVIFMTMYYAEDTLLGPKVALLALCLSVHIINQYLTAGL